MLVILRRLVKVFLLVMGITADRSVVSSVSFGSDIMGQRQHLLALVVIIK